MASRYMINAFLNFIFWPISSKFIYIAVPLSLETSQIVHASIFPWDHLAASRKITPALKNDNKPACGSNDVGPYLLFNQWRGKGICGGHISVIKRMTFTDLGNEQGDQTSKAPTSAT